MFREYLPQIIITGILFILIPISRVVATRIISVYGKRALRNENRIIQIARVTSMLISFLLLLMIAVVWGVQPKNMLVAMSSIFAVIGVAMFAQWSILSNITAGIIIFFSTPFRIGDKIRILDKDMPLEAVIEDIYTFNMHLRTMEGELVILPNSLFMQKIVAVDKSAE